MNALEAFPLHGAWPQEFLGLEDRPGEKAGLPFHHHHYPPPRKANFPRTPLGLSSGSSRS